MSSSSKTPPPRLFFVCSTMSSLSASFARHSNRKRQIPVRYGFEEDNRQVKRPRSKSCEVQLLDLPLDVVRRVAGYLGTVGDRFALQGTSKLWRNLSNSPELLQGMPLLSSTTLIQAEDTAEQVTQRLLPFAQHSNRDALWLLGRLAIYVEDDVEAGMSLLEKGQRGGDLRCQYELANLLIRNRKDAASQAQGNRFIEDAAAAGHACAIICSSTPPTGEARRQVYARAAAEMKATAGLSHLTQQKAPPPRPHWVGSTCSNPWCSRTCYRVRRRRARAWLQTKGYSAHWKRLRPTILACGVTPQHYCADHLFYVPDFHMCARCMTADYCGRACQVVHWATHKTHCQPPQLGVPRVRQRRAVRQVQP